MPNRNRRERQREAARSRAEHYHLQIHVAHADVGMNGFFGYEIHLFFISETLEARCARFSNGFVDSRDDHASFSHSGGAAFD